MLAASTDIRKDVLKILRRSQGPVVLSGVAGMAILGSSFLIPVGTSTAEPGDASANVGMVWVTYTAMVALVCLGGAVALFRARERLGTALVAIAAPLSLLTPLVWVVALLALAAALWAWFDLRRRRFEHVGR